jgi:hypothetical protein
MTSKKVIIEDFKEVDIDLYQLEVSFGDRGCALSFDKDQWDDCFDRLSSYEQAKNKDAIKEWLNEQKDFLDVVSQFLDSRIELGWGDKVYALNILHTHGQYGYITIGYDLDDKVYRVGNFQIAEDIFKRWHLSSASKLEADSYDLMFSHTLQQREPVRFVITPAVIEEKMNGALIDGEVFSKFIEDFNKNNDLRLRFSKASDLVNQKFKSKRLPEPITDKNWDEFYSNPKGFVTHSFKIPA